MVYEYKDKPIMCKTCLAYGHSKNRGTEEQKCANCGGVNHPVELCTAETKYVHCSEDHSAGNIRCKKHRYQEEIIAVQTKERVTNNQAIALLDKQRPTYRQIDYARAAAAKTTTTESRDENSPARLSVTFEQYAKGNSSLGSSNRAASDARDIYRRERFTKYTSGVRRPASCIQAR